VVRLLQEMEGFWDLSWMSFESFESVAVGSLRRN
jgi:hypothetical protein